MKHIYISIIFILISINLVQVQAQGINQDRFKLAETFENNGDYKGAAKIYEELYKSNPKQDNYFKGLARCYSQLNQYSTLLPIIEQHLKSQENVNPTNLSLYAEILWKSGKTDDANKAWNQAINDFSKDINTYTIIANTQIKLQLFDKAINTLETARSISKKKEQFADELSQLYILSGDFKKASEEIIKYYETSRNLPQAQGRITAMLNSQNTVKYLDELISSKAKNENVLFISLYAWYLRVTNRLEKSLEEYINLDKLLKSNGMEVYNFATTCSKDNQYDIALKAFGYVIDLGKSTPYIINALFGYSRVLESRSEELKTTNPKEYEEIIERYKNIITLYPNNNISFDAMYRIADIYFSKLNKTSQSIEQYRELFTKGKSNPIAYKGLNSLADIFFALDKIDSAKYNYNLVLNSKTPNIQQEKDYAQYRLALIEYYTGNIDSSMTLFKAVADNSGSNSANDALDKLFMYETNKSLTKALSLFATAEKFDAQGKDIDAIKNYTECQTLAAGENLGEMCYIRISNLQYKSAKYIEMRATLNKFINEYPESIYLDYATYQIGNSFYNEKNFTEALKIFTEMLVKFPKTIYIEDIREKIRIIRTNSNG